MDGRGSGKSLGYVDDARLVKRANRPERSRRDAASVIFFIAVMVDVLQTGDVTISVIEGQDLNYR